MRMQDKRCRIQDTGYMIHDKKIVHRASCIVYLVLFLLLTSHFSLSYADEKGVPINMELRDVELSDVLRALGQEHGINIIIDETVKGKVTVSLSNVPLWDAIDSILKGKGFTYIKEGNIIRIAPHAVIAKENEDARKAGKEKQLALEELAPLERKTYRLMYVNAEDVKNQLLGITLPTMTYDEKQRILSSRGTVTADRTSNMLIVTDIPTKIAQANDFIKEIDQPTRQVMIEAKIVEVSTNASRALGIQWGAMYRSGDVYVHGGATGTVGALPSRTTGPGTTTTGTTPLTGTAGFGGSALNVNFPAAIGATTGGAALGIGLLAKNAILDLQISALETQGNARTLSSPKVMVLNNQEAYIKSGTGILIPTSTTTAGATTTTSVSEKEALLQLRVTPRVINDDQIYLKILTSRDSFNFALLSQGSPTKNTRETQTNLIVKNGETIVIGGIYEETESESEGGVPLLSKIPLLGWLFKKETKTKDKTELLIFITPRIKVD